MVGIQVLEKGWNRSTRILVVFLLGAAFFLYSINPVGAALLHEGPGDAGVGEPSADLLVPLGPEPGPPTQLFGFTWGG